MKKCIYTLLCCLCLTACGTPEDPVSFGVGPQRLVYIGPHNARCTYDPSSQAAKVACEDQLNMLQAGQVLLSNAYGRNGFTLNLSCDSVDGQPAGIRRCTRVFQDRIDELLRRQGWEFQYLNPQNYGLITTLQRQAAPRSRATHRVSPPRCNAYTGECR